MKVECELRDVFEVTEDTLQSSGLLLTSVGVDDVYNVMTIGWGLMGRLWRKPVFMVAVRPSRHTYKLIEETGEFTVNVPTKDMSKTVAYCGKVSGRDHDKFNETDLDAVEGKGVKSPMISDCSAHFECVVIGKSKVLPELLTKDVINTFYSIDDYHTLYYGKIVTVLQEKR